MGTTKLKEDLSNCLINFDRRVLITELLDDYKVPYEEVNNVLVDYLKEQEEKQKLKYEKRYLVHGLQEGENKKEIFKVVEEQKLKEWIKRLSNAESSLYSVEVAGGAKSAAAVFKPMSVEEGVNLKIRHGAKVNGTAATSSTAEPKVDKKEIKPEPKKPELENGSSKTTKETPKTSKKTSPKTEAVTKKSPKVETTPTKKPKEKATAAKKGIGNFFAPASSSKKSLDTKDTKAEAVVKPPTPKKMEDFFKKQTEKPKSSTESLKKPAANTSVQLFDDEEEEPEDAVSSDEEEKIEALKRDIISSDVEMAGGDDDEDSQEAKPTASKRRRILDSDDEEEDTPAVKHEKLDVKDEIVDVDEATTPLQDETYLDEDGFVITKKPKQKPKSPAKKVTKKSPPVTMKISPKGSKKSLAASSSAKDSKSAGASNPAAKTKQAGIMNFFSKK